MTSHNGITVPVLAGNMPTCTVYLICGFENKRVVLNNMLLENILYSFKLLCLYIFHAKNEPVFLLRSAVSFFCNQIEWFNLKDCPLHKSSMKTELYNKELISDIKHFTILTSTAPKK